MGFCDGFKFKKVINKNQKEYERAPEYTVEIDNSSERDIGLSFDETTYTIDNGRDKIILSLLKSQFPEEWKKKNLGYYFDKKDNGYRLIIKRDDRKVVFFNLSVDKVIDFEEDDFFIYEKEGSITKITGIKEEYRNFITKIIIPEGVDSFSSSLYCPNVESIYVPASIKEINVWNCNLPKLKEIVVDKNNPNYQSPANMSLFDIRNKKPLFNVQEKCTKKQKSEQFSLFDDEDVPEDDLPF